MSHVPVAGRRQNRWGEGELLRADIVAAARRLLERDGTEAAVTLRGVAREAGITAPAIYAHFGNGHELLEAVIADVAEEATARLTEALRVLPAGTAARDQLRTYCEVYVSFAHERPASYQALFLRHRPSALPSVRTSMSRITQAFEALVAEVVPSLSEPEVSVRATLTWCALHGLAALPPHHPRFAWPSVDALVEELLDIHLAEPPAALRGDLSPSVAVG